MIHVWHANTKASHENPKVANNFANWIKEKCGKIGEVKVKRGNEHDCLGMALRHEGKKVLIDVTKHAKEKAMRATGCIGEDEGNYYRLNHFDYVPPNDEDQKRKVRSLD